MRPRTARPTLYPHALSLLTRTVIEPAFDAQYLTVAEWLPKFWAWPEARRRRWQLAQLARVLSSAGRDVPYYRSRINGDDPRAALEALRSVRKSQMRDDMQAFVSRRLPLIPHIHKRTGGSSGEPFQYPLDKRAWAQAYGASLYAYARAGYRYGERVVMLGGPTSLGLSDRPSLLMRARHKIERHDFSNVGFDLSPRASLHRVRRAARMGAGLWYGYAGTIAAMADAVLDAGEPVRAPTVIVTTSEPLQPAWRTRIETAFGRRVLDEYGCNDGGIMSHSCPAGRWHVAENLSIIEILDGDTPCPPGVEGDVTVTNLHATALPFLRYKIGDRAALGKDPCPCGRDGVTLERLSGRDGDRILLPDGTELSIFAFYHVFARTPDVRRWQIVQDAADRITVRLDARPGYDEDQADLIRRYARLRAGEAVSVQVVTDQRIEHTSGGKQRIVVREETLR